jgi:16S rRNA (cytosine967-C5)-methyltransferase
LLNDENEAQVEAFLARYPTYRQVPVAMPEALRGPYLRLSPRRHDTDGFFAAILERLA